MVASLARRFGDLDIAEEAAGDAFLAAAERWPIDGQPANPGGWLMTTATRRAIDRLRRENVRDQRHRAAAMITHQPDPVGIVEDDQLRLIFTCCHPALAPEARTALTLRLVAGLTVPEIARAFLIPETTLAQRITRAKSKIRAAAIPLRVPEREDLANRLADVLAVIYLIFNEGYLPGEPGHADLAAEGVRLARLMRGLMPTDGEVAGLLALMLLTESRRGSRYGTSGELVTLADQGRGGWDHALIAEGHALVRERLASGLSPGVYQLQAAINAVHTDAGDARDTDWSQVVALYDQLYALQPTPVVALNRAVAIAEMDGPEVALAIVEPLDLVGYHSWHVTRADLLRRLGRSREARAAYARAIELAVNPGEIAYLTRRLGELVG
ncbi:RNA polymerase sigma factor [Nocardioides baekrokdamisoli]|uniref:RNA polymerase sigma factor n=1 Tax=Nocardioides baekrokdamisoli TaxID=1804624 RepID=UPI001E643F13|nr:sigma-70 family RNA polymerase sigma factor [Nocardioides baekrokdamisoli]